MLNNRFNPLPTRYAESNIMQQEALDVTKLSPLQRVILTSNGTVTKLLEDLIGEQLIVIKLHESLQIHEQAIEYLELPVRQQVIQRKICLQGKDSGINWLYAESTIVPARLDTLFRDELLESQIPIGSLWSKHRVETFKELLPPFQQPAGELAQYFSISEQQYLLGRTYRVYSGQQPIMMLTEKFPRHYFIDLTQHHVHIS
jgi:chorismate-pyruvate lyase